MYSILLLGILNWLNICDGLLHHWLLHNRLLHHRLLHHRLLHDRLSHSRWLLWNLLVIQFLIVVLEMFLHVFSIDSVRAHIDHVYDPDNGLNDG